MQPTGRWRGWQWFLAGAGCAVGLLILLLLFAAYQMPELLLDWTNLRYCS